jgi:phosphatidylglycerophosphate synthase
MGTMSTTPAGSPAATFKPAVREHTSILAGAEKRTLIRIAQSLPAWVNSDHLTALGFAGLVLAAASYWYASVQPYALLAVIGFLAINWFGDSLDGTLARVRNKQRPRYGFYVDHILDSIGMSILMGGLALSGFIQPDIAFGFLIAYLLLSAEIYLATHAIGKFHLSHWSLGPTELRILLSIGNLVLLWKPDAGIHNPGFDYSMFDIGFAIGGVALLVILIQTTIKHTVQLYKEETK